MDYSDDETVLLSLVEKSIKLIPLNKEEWEAKSGFSFSDVENPGRSLGTKNDSTDSLTFPTISNLRKACSSTSSSTNRNHRKTLIAVLEKWILQNHTKKDDTKTFGVRALTKSRGAGESADSNPRSLLDHYVNKIIMEQQNDKSKSSSAANTTAALPNNPPGMGCPLFPERDLSRSLLLRCHNTLLDGEVCSLPSSLSTPWSPSMLSILRCVASLHYRLWYFRTIHKKDPQRAYGFALASSSGNNNTNPKVTLWISLVLLEKPCINIGGRDPFYVYTMRYELPGSSSATSSTSSSPASASHILQELSKFLYLYSRALPCPYRDALPLDNPQKSLIREGCTVMPTITGSLVIRCQNVSAVQELLNCSRPEDDDGETIQTLLKSFVEVADSSTNDDEEWYIKYKTPTVGQFWDNSRVAINGPRGALLRKGKKQAAQQHPPCVQRWLFLHPIDSWIGNYCSITITRSSGIAFSIAKKEHDLSWEDYCQEFGGLARSTLEFQTRCNSLVHGDINEGNLLYYHCSRTGCRNSIGESLFPIGNRLVLIDWDEATRPKALRRKVETDEERLRYPEGLLDFPEQYTQQQLMHLFGTLAKTYYPSECQRIHNGWTRTLLFPPLSTEAPALFTKYLSRSTVERRFNAMLRYLNVATKGNSTS